MVEMIGDYIQWFLPVFWILFLLVDFYRAENRRQWLKSNLRTAAIVTAFLLPVGLIWFVSMLVDK